LTELWSVIAVIAMIGCILYPTLRRTSASIVITIGLVLIFMVELVDLWSSPTGSNNTVLTDLAFSPIYLSTGDSIYTIFTSIFLHASFYHIFLNAISLVFIGMMLEERIGTNKFVLLFILTGMIGSLVYGIANLGYLYLVVGASGAISGLLGALLVLYPREKVNFIIYFLPLRNTPMWVIVMIFLGLQLLIALSSGTNVAWQSHIGGLASGMALAPLIMRMKTKDKELLGESIDIGKLATTPKEKEIAERIRAETIPEVREAWIGQFSQTAKCPICGARIKANRGSLKCMNGHKFKIEK